MIQLSTEDDGSSSRRTFWVSGRRKVSARQVDKYKVWGLRADGEVKGGREGSSNISCHR